MRNSNTSILPLWRNIKQRAVRRVLQRILRSHQHSMNKHDRNRDDQADEQLEPDMSPENGDQSHEWEESDDDFVVNVETEDSEGVIDGAS